jgi:nicotinamidase-related amidase
MKNVLVVVDMQKDFLLPDGALNLGHDTVALRNRIATFISSFEGDVYLTYDSHKEDAVEFKTFPKHFITGTPGAELCDEIAHKGQPLPKQSYTSDLIATVLLNVVQPDTTVHVVGVCTHICVHDVIAGLVNRTKNDHNFVPKVIVHRDMVDDFDPEMAEFALKRLQRLYGVVVE